MGSPVTQPNSTALPLPRRPFEDVWPQLMSLLVSQGKSEEAWALELRREERIEWEIEQERLARV